MAYVWMPEPSLFGSRSGRARVMAVRKDDITEQQLAALELRYRWVQQSLNEARARDADFDAAVDPDDPERRRAMVRVQHLQAQLMDIQQAMERLEARMQPCAQSGAG